MIYLALGSISVYTLPGFEIILYLERGISMMERAKWTVNGKRYLALYTLKKAALPKRRLRLL